MSILFIAEKPDAAMAIAKALSPTFEKKKGFIIGGNGYIFTWAFGHLVGLKEPEDLNPEYKTWKMEHLPIIPERIMLRALPGKETQLQTIKQLAQSAKMVINCTDAGQEGELIFHYISLILQLTNKPTKRLWTSSLQPTAIQKAFKDMKDHSEYQTLRNAAVSRSISDWIIGINSSRAATLATGHTIKAGRIMTPVLALVYDRHIERERFKKSKYYPIEATFHQQDVTYQGKLQTEELILDKQIATNIMNAVQHQSAQITELKEEQKEVPAPLLLDLTDASRIANKKYGFKGTKTLEVLQSLYLKKCITYPRTSSRYVTPDEIPLMHQSFDALQSAFPHLAQKSDKSLVTAENKRICNEIGDHHALLPEPVIAADLTDDERKVYEIIVERFFLQFQAPAKWQHLTIQSKVGQYSFLSRYKTPVQLGWQALIPKVQTETEEEVEGYPRIMESLPIHCNKATISELTTVPQPLYNDGTLMDMMNNISRRLNDEKMKEILKDRGIGTVATRAETISKLEKSGYLAYEQKSITITKAGITIIEMFRQTKINTLTSPEFTAIWEIELENIRKGKPATKFNNQIKEFAHVIVEEVKKIQVTKMDFQETIGSCPQCDQPLIKSEKRFYCSAHNNGCEFFIWRNQFNKTITNNMLVQLLKNNKTNFLTFQSADKTRKYIAKLILNLPVQNGKLSLEFKNDTK